MVGEVRERLIPARQESVVMDNDKTTCNIDNDVEIYLGTQLT